MAGSKVRVAVKLSSETVSRIDRLVKQDESANESNRSRIIRVLIERGLETTVRGDTPPAVRRRA